jgi:hypothetical protein
LVQQEEPPLDKFEEEDDEQDEQAQEDNFKDEIKRLLMQGRSKSKKKAKQEKQEQNEEYDVEQDEEIDDQMKEYIKENGLEDHLATFKKQKKEMKHDIKVHGPATELSNDILSYERFFPGRILGNTFTISNRTNETIHLKVSFTNKGVDTEYAKQKLMEFYEVKDSEEIEQPYLGYLSRDLIDSQKSFECWFIEDPYAKTLVKEAYYELKPKESFEFIIVLKSPIIKKTHFLTTNVKIKNETHGEEHRVFAFGSLDVPKLFCPKEIMDVENKYS